MSNTHLFDGTTLEHWTAGPLHRLRPTLGYLNKLIERMEAEGFPTQDYRSASEAEDRLQHLLTVIH